MQLIITVLGTDHSDLPSDLTRAIRDSQCSIVESRMTEMGADFAALFMVEGNWNHIARLEHAIEALARRDTMKLHMRRVEDPVSTELADPLETGLPDGVPYAVDIVASDDLEHAHALTEFFSVRGIKIVDMNCTRCPAPYGGNLIFLAHLIIRIPSGMRMISLRDEFLEFCDQQYLDAILEPVKR